MAPSAHEITSLLTVWCGGDHAALHQLMPFVYDELCRLAHHHMKRESPGHILQTTLSAILICRNQRERE